MNVFFIVSNLNLFNSISSLSFILKSNEIFFIILNLKPFNQYSIFVLKITNLNIITLQHSSQIYILILTFKNSKLKYHPNSKFISNQYPFIFFPYPLKSNPQNKHYITLFSTNKILKSEKKSTKLLKIMNKEEEEEEQ